MKNKKIGFIGQGWIGKNYSDDFEKRGYEIVRYSLEEPYVKNKEKIFLNVSETFKNNKNITKSW